VHLSSQASQKSELVSVSVSVSAEGDKSIEGKTSTGMALPVHWRVPNPETIRCQKVGGSEDVGSPATNHSSRAGHL
jgi:hypothetical protein